jgi:hypothetical protein
LTCDHGIRLDRWCDDCERGVTFREPDPQPVKEWSRLAALACVTGLALIVLVAWGETRHG